MELKFEALSFTSLKRKKPWGKLLWLGDAKESILLIDNKKISSLNLASGKIKKKDSIHKQILNKSHTITKFFNDKFLASLLQNGNVIIYFYETSHKSFIEGHTDFSNKSDYQSIPFIYVDPLCKCVVVVYDFTEIYVWERKNVYDNNNNKKDVLNGKWHKIRWQFEMCCPDLEENQETCVSAAFYHHKFLGNVLCINITFFYEHMLKMQTAIVKWEHFKIDQRLFVSWTSNSIFLTNLGIIRSYYNNSTESKASALHLREALIPSWHPKQPILAIGVNQAAPAHAAIVYLEPLLGALTSRSLLGLGVAESRRPHLSRAAWLRNLVWEPGGDWLAGITGTGCLVVLPRLSCPVLIQVVGQCMELGPSYFPPVLPLATAGGVMAAEGSVTGQVFSLAMHPRHSVFLLSDGFSVIVFRLTENTSNWVRRLAALSIGCWMEEQKQFEKNENHRNESNDGHDIDDAKSLASTSSLTSEVILRKNLNCCQEFSVSQLERITRWTQSISEEMNTTAGADTLQGFRISGIAASPTASDFDEDEEDENDRSDNEDLEAFSMGKRRDSWARLDVMSGKTAVRCAPEYSDSGLQSMFGDDESDIKEITLRRSRHLLLCSWGLLVSGGSSADYLSSSHEAANITLEACFRNLANTLEILQEADESSRHAYLDYVLHEIADQFNAVLNLLTFDAVEQNLHVPVCRFVHECIVLLLHCGPLRALLPVVHCAQLCTSLAERAQMQLREVYGWHRVTQHNIYDAASTDTFWPRQLLLNECASRTSPPLGSEPISDEITQSKTLSSSICEAERGLQNTWNTLYDFITELYQGIRPQSEQCLEVAMCHVQKRIFELCDKIPQNVGGNKHEVIKITAGDQLLLEGRDEEAAVEWRRKLFEHGVKGGKLYSRRAVRFLHSLMYLSLLRGELRNVINLVQQCAFMVENGRDLDTSSFPFLEAYQFQISTPLLRYLYRRSPLTQTLARLMAAYFTAQPLFIRPPHQPVPLPSSLDTDSKKKFVDSVYHRQLPLAHNTLTLLIRQNGLESEWQPERCVELLLLGGLPAEAAALAYHLGDWRSAVTLGVVCMLSEQVSTRSIAQARISRTTVQFHQPVKQRPNELLLEQCLSLLRRVLERQKNDISTEELVTTLRDQLTAACLADVELLEPFLQHIVKELAETVSKFGVFVPETVYLPAPPLYCPQPANTESNLSSSHQLELQLRGRISCLVEFAFCLLHSAHIALPCAGWYTDQLLEAESVAKSVELVRETDGKDCVERFQDFRMAAEAIKSCDMRAILCNFRDLCALLWTCQARDKLSLALRQRSLLRVCSSGTKLQTEDWLKKTAECLSWMQLLLPCASLLDKNNNSGALLNCLLSLAAEYPPDRDVADLLVDWGLTLNTEELPVELQNRLAVIQREWIHVVLREPSSHSGSGYIQQRQKRSSRSSRLKGETLSVYYQARCIEEPESWRLRRQVFGEYEHEVVLLPKDELNVGSRSFETEPAFLDWLDVVFSVVLARSLEQVGREKAAIPLIFTLRKEVAEKEIESGVTNVVATGHTQLSSPSNTPSSPRKPPLLKSFNRNNLLERQLTRHFESEVPASSKRTGQPRLWRSNSSSTLQQDEQLTPLNFDGINGSSQVEDAGTWSGRRCITPRQGASAKRGSLTDACLKLQECLATPRAIDAFKDAPVGLCFEPENAEQIHATERLNWLVRWTHRHQPLLAASPCDKHITTDSSKLAQMRIRLNTNLLVYTVFGSTIMPTNHSSRRNPSENIAAASIHHSNVPSTALQLQLDNDVELQDTTPVPTPRKTHSIVNSISTISAAKEKMNENEVVGDEEERFCHPKMYDEKLGDDFETELSIAETISSSVSHTGRLREIARRQLEPFVTDAKNGPGPSELRNANNSVVLNVVIPSTHDLIEPAIATNRANRISSESTMSVDVSSLTPHDNAVLLERRNLHSTSLASSHKQKVTQQNATKISEGPIAANSTVRVHGQHASDNVKSAMKNQNFGEIFREEIRRVIECQLGELLLAPGATVDNSSHELCRSDLLGIKVSNRRQRRRGKHLRNLNSRHSSSDNDEDVEDDSTYNKKQYGNAKTKKSAANRFQEHSTLGLSSSFDADYKPSVLAQALNGSSGGISEQEYDHVHEIHQTVSKPQTIGTNMKQQLVEGTLNQLRLLGISSAHQAQPGIHFPALPHTVSTKVTPSDPVVNNSTAMPKFLRLQQNGGNQSGSNANFNAPLLPTARLLPAETVGVLVPPPTHVPRLLVPPPIGFRLLCAPTKPLELSSTPRLIRLIPEKVAWPAENDKNIQQINTADSSNTPPMSLPSDSSSQTEIQSTPAPQLALDRVDIGTSIYKDAGVQFDALSDEEDVLFHHGFVIQPGLVMDTENSLMACDVGSGNTPRATTDVGLNVTPRLETGLLRQKGVPLLPPDVMSRLRLGLDTPSDRNTARRFLSVVSVDEGIWDQLVDDKNMPALSEEQLRDSREMNNETPRRVVTWKDQNTQFSDVTSIVGDPLTVRLLNPLLPPSVATSAAGKYVGNENVQGTQVLNQGLRDMDARLKLIEELSAKLDRDFVHSDKILRTLEVIDVAGCRLEKKELPHQMPSSSTSPHRSPPRSPHRSPSRSPHQSPPRSPQQSPPSHLLKEDQVYSARSSHHSTASDVPHSLHSRTLESPSFEFKEDLKLSLEDMMETDGIRDDTLVEEQFSPLLRQPLEDNKGQRQQLRKWMAEKREERMREFRLAKQQKVEQEVHAYKPTKDAVSLNQKQLAAEELVRKERRRQLEMENEKLRDELVNQLVSTNVAVGGGESANRVPSPPRLQSKKSASEMMAERLVTEQRNARQRYLKKAGMRPRDAEPDDFEFNSYADYDDYLDHWMEISSQATNEILNGVTKSQGAVKQERLSKVTLEEVDEMCTFNAPIKRPYTELVRLQRPNLTRRTGPAQPPKTYVEQLQETVRGRSFRKRSGSCDTAASENKEQQGGQLSSRSPLRHSGLSSTGARHPVTTYAQRLQSVQPQIPKRQRVRQISPAPRQPERKNVQSGIALSADTEADDISEWSVPDAVRNMLYGSVAQHSDVSAMVETFSENGSSVASYLDWDRVEQLIQAEPTSV